MTPPPVETYAVLWNHNKIGMRSARVVGNVDHKLTHFFSVVDGLCPGNIGGAKREEQRQDRQEIFVFHGAILGADASSA